MAPEELNHDKKCEPCSKLPCRSESTGHLQVLTSCCGRWRRLIFFQGLPLDRRCTYCKALVGDLTPGEHE